MFRIIADLENETNLIYIYIYIYILFFSFFKELMLTLIVDASAKLTIHMKCQDLFSLKNKKNICRISSATNVFAWRLKHTSA